MCGTADVRSAVDTKAAQAGAAVQKSQRKKKKAVAKEHKDWHKDHKVAASNAADAATNDVRAKYDSWAARTELCDEMNALWLDLSADSPTDATDMLKWLALHFPSPAAWEKSNGENSGATRSLDESAPQETAA